MIVSPLISPRVLLCCALWAMLSIGVSADDNSPRMIVVVGTPGQIKSGNEVISTVPAGTRLWAQEFRDDAWARVKLPNAEQVGWIYHTHFQMERMSPVATRTYQAGFKHWEEYKRLKEADELEEAVIELRKWIEIGKECYGADHPKVAYRIEDLADCLRDLRDDQTSLEAYERSLTTRVKWLGRSHKSLNYAKRQIGRLHNRLSQFEEARQILEGTLPIAIAGYGSDDSATIWTRKYLAAAYGGLDEGELLIEQRRAILASEERKYGPDTTEVAGALYLLSQALTRSTETPEDKLKEALSHSERALKIRRNRIDDADKSTLDTLEQVARITLNLEHYDAARLRYEEYVALAAPKLGEDHPEVLTALIFQGYCEFQIGELGLAKASMSRAIEYETPIIDASGRNHVASWMLRYSRLLCWLGEHSEALRVLDKAIRQQQFAESSYEEFDVEVAHAKGMAFSGLGRHHVAIAQYRQAMHHANRLGLKALGTRQKLGQALLSAGQYEDAQIELRKVQDAAFEEGLVGPYSVASAANCNLAKCALALGDYARAVSLYGEELEAWNAIEESQMTSLDSAQAGRAYEDLAVALTLVGRISEAKQHFDDGQRLRCIWESRILPTLDESSLAARLISARQRRSLAFATKFYERAGVASKSAGWLLNIKSRVAESQAERVLLSQPQTAAHVRSLRSVQARLASQSLKAIDFGNQEALAALENERRNLIRKIAANTTGLSASEPWVSLGELRENLQPTDLFVNILRTANYDFERLEFNHANYFAWVVPAMDQGVPRIVDLGDANHLDGLVSAYRKSLKQSPSLTASESVNPAHPADHIEKSRALSNALYAPIRKHLEGIDRLIISPDGALWLVPWAALPIEDRRFLIEELQVDYATSGRELVRDRNLDRAKSEKSVVMSDPAFDMLPNQPNADDDKFQVAKRSAESLKRASRLPGTAKEAAAIMEPLTRIARSAPLHFSQTAATETKFKQLFRPRMLVMITHGFFFGDQQVTTGGAEESPGQFEQLRMTDDGKPIENPLLRCGLLLAGCNVESGEERLDDGILTGLEVVGTDLRGTELVVLSACDTGVGDVVNGDGVAGLRQAFQFAGAETVLASLWSIPDEGTVPTMQDFFEQMADGQSKGAALRAAQLNGIERLRAEHGTAHPYFWAAFTLTGRSD